ncbi:DNA translocase FtsK [Kiritimatiella glycovorans]|nr:DNA translocase FtsK [Kiritimatiella glycovorans]
MSNLSLMGKDNTPKARSGPRELAGVVWLALFLIACLSFITYHPGDISALQSPPVRPAHNAVGPVGGWFAYTGMLFFGLAGYGIPIACLLIGLLAIVRSDRRLWPRIAWALGALLCLGTLLDLSGAMAAGLVDRLNLPSSGGVLGQAIAHRTLGAWFGAAGTGVLAAAGLIVCFAGLTDIYPLALLRGSGTLFRNLRKWGGALKAGLAAAAARVQAAVQRRREAAATPEVDEDPQPASFGGDDEGLFPAAPTASGERESPPKKKPRKKKPAKPAEPPREEPEPEPEPRPVSKGPSEYALPPLTLLQQPAAGKAGGGNPDTDRESEVLQSTLTEFNVQAQVTNAEVGPVVTRYEVRPAPGVRVGRISQLSNDIARALKARTVRIQAPVPGKDVVGIEIPNPETSMVVARQLVETKTFRSAKTALPLILGKDVSGKNLIADLADMPHILIAGATGSGKTVCMNSLLAGLLMSRTPDELKLMLIDPKIVEFQHYQNLPHLVVPVITDPKKVIFGLRWAIKEMERRFQLFSKAGVRNIAGYNARPKVRQGQLFEEGEDETSELPERLPYIVIVIDELADLMMVAQAEIEGGIARLAQLSRAVGIHMIIATQRPSVNVITGTIKANFPARIAFQVAQKVDSRTIIDASGADKLLGRGDMLFAPPDASRLVRAQGTFTTDEEIEKITEHWRGQGQPEYVQEIHKKLDNPSAPTGLESEEESKDDDVLEQAIEIIRQTKRASTSSLQRRLRIGYNRAARLMDQLEERGVVGPPSDTGPREILIDFDGEIPQNRESAETPPAE